MLKLTKCIICTVFSKNNFRALEQAPEGFLEYGPPGFAEYGPPKGDLNQEVRIEN